jgi:hypothetical protein
MIRVDSRDRALGLLSRVSGQARSQPLLNEYGWLRNAFNRQ